MKMNFRKNGLKLACCIFTISLIGCTPKDSDTDGGKYNDGKSVLIEDMPGDTEASMSNGVKGKIKRDFQVVLFNLRTQKQIRIKTKEDTLKWFKSKEWDLAFRGPYNSVVYVNNAEKHEKNPGFGGPVKNTAVVKVEKNYDFVNEAPSDEEFDKSDVVSIGWEDSPSANGWFTYVFEKHIMQALPNRTFVIRLQDGKYAKIQFISAYKGNPPAVTDLHWPAPYFTFRYFIQEDGSKNLRTK